jgi:hypothetical protein
VAQRAAMDAAGALGGPIAHGEDDGLALPQGDHVRARLLAGALLDQDELAPLEVPAGLIEQDRHLQRKDVLPVEILVQAIVVPAPVAEHQRRRPGLACGVAAGQPVGQRRREAAVLAQPLGPAVRDGRQRRIELLAQRLDEPGQRIGEVLVLALAIAVPRHDDPAAEPAGLAVEGGQPGAGLRIEDRAGQGEAAVVELAPDPGPVQAGQCRHARASRASSAALRSTPQR